MSLKQWQYLRWLNAFVEILFFQPFIDEAMWEVCTYEYKHNNMYKYKKDYQTMRYQVDINKLIVEQDLEHLTDDVFKIILGIWSQFHSPDKYWFSLGKLFEPNSISLVTMKQVQIMVCVYFTSINRQMNDDLGSLLLTWLNAYLSMDM